MEDGRWKMESKDRQEANKVQGTSSRANNEGKEMILSAIETKVKVQKSKVKREGMDQR